MKTLKKFLTFTFTLIIFLAIFVNFGDFQTVGATGLNENNNYLAQTRQRRELSPEQKAEVKKRADEQQRQINAQLEVIKKNRENQRIVIPIISGFFTLLVAILWVTLIRKFPWYIKPVFFLLVVGVYLILILYIGPLIVKVLGF